MIDLKTDRSIDLNIAFFFLNACFVVVGYWLEIALGVLDQFKIIKIITIVVAIIYLFLFSGKEIKYRPIPRAWIMNTFMTLLLIGLFFSIDFERSLNRFLILAPFLVYLNYLLQYLYSRYEVNEIKWMFIKIFRIVYLIPIIVFFFNSGGFQAVNIYGDTSMGFNSSHYGWSAVIIIVATIDLFFSSKTNKKSKIFLFLSCTILLYIIIISGSRSSYLCILAIFIALILRNRSIGSGFKLAFVSIAAGVTFYFIQNDQSALVKRFEKTKVQLDEGQDRLILTRKSLEIINTNDRVLLAGVGFDNFKNGLMHYAGYYTEALLHNSYLEILVDNGIIVFSFFFFGIFLKAILRYIYHDIGNYLFFIPVIVIPFFESNFGAGQFLFFPWMFFLIYYIYYKAPQIPVKTG